MRGILNELVGEGVASVICPPPTETPDMSQTYGFEGVDDPRDRVVAEAAASELARADRQRQPRSPERLEELQAILGKYCDALGYVSQGVA